MKPNEPAPDRLLVGRILRRDRDALSEAYDQHAPNVYGLALRVLGQAADAEAIVSDVFWALWQKPQNFDASRSTLRTYLMVMARSRAIDRMRSAAVHERKVRESAESRLSVYSEGPQQVASRGERGAAVRNALEQLNEEQRQVLALAYYHGKTQEEIAQQLEMPLGTVKTRVRIGLKKLRSALRNLGGSSEL